MFKWIRRKRAESPADIKCREEKEESTKRKLETAQRVIDMMDKLKIEKRSVISPNFTPERRHA